MAISVSSSGGSPAPSIWIAGRVDLKYNISNVAISASGSDSNDSRVVIESTGVVFVRSDATASAFSSPVGPAPDFINHGRVDVAGKTGAIGLQTYDTLPWRFENTGLFSVTSNVDTIGVWLVSGGDFYNTGSITSGGFQSSVAVKISGEDANFYNSGEIGAHSFLSFRESVAVEFNGRFKGASAFVNDGTITGDIALLVRPYGNFADKAFVNNGRMIGLVDLGPESSRFTNAGYIRGDVKLGEGADHYSGGAQGRTEGMVHGDGGNDTLVGGAANDSLSGDLGEDSVFGGAGDDFIRGGLGQDILHGGDGFDTLAFDDAQTGVIVDFAAGRATGAGTDTIAGFERALGGSGFDTLSGGSGADTLMGAGGKDQLNGRDGADWLEGGASDDIIWGDGGDDTIFGGGGDDQIFSGSGGAYIRGEDGNDTIVGSDDAFEDLHGNAGNDSLAGGGSDDWVVGGKDNDVLAGGGGADIVYGNLGNDSSYGEEGNDIVRGGQGDDWVVGGAGDDWLSGDRGYDTIVGGVGADTFHTFGDAGVDRVIDFNRAEGDRVQIDAGRYFTVTQEGADVVIRIEGDGEMTLVGVDIATLTGDWIFTL